MGIMAVSSDWGSADLARRVHSRQGQGRCRHCDRQHRPFAPLFRTAFQHPAKQGEEAMTTENAQLPEGGFPLAPHIVCAGAADAIAFYKEAFGATERFARAS